VSSLRLMTTMAASQAQASQRNTATPLTNPWTSESSRSACTSLSLPARGEGLTSTMVEVS